MSEPEPNLSTEWFALGDQDLAAARILLTEDGPLPVVAFHLQQTIEKYLKGYLLNRGWQLRRIHDLEILLQEAIQLDEDFRRFLADCQRITEFYIESRYPTGFFTILDEGDLRSDLAATTAIIDLIRDKLASPS